MEAQALSGPSPATGRTRFALVAHRLTGTNRALLRAAASIRLEPLLVTPGEAFASLGPGDIALGRLDIRPELDGVEDGLWQLRRLERAGVTVLNRASALAAAHDKLATAVRLQAAELPHPPTQHLTTRGEMPALEPPLVLKPRFGSWGTDVLLCEDPQSLRAGLELLGSRAWFGASGVLAQEFVPTPGFDLRLIVAAGRVVGAIRRFAAPGEWRTNVALGAARAPLDPPADACALAVAAAEALGGDLVGVDLLPTPGGGFVVLEVNGAVDFAPAYLRSADVFRTAVAALIAGGVLGDLAHA